MRRCWRSSAHTWRPLAKRVVEALTRIPLLIVGEGILVQDARTWESDS